jgi:membrane protein/epoxyqueuosine reductase
VRSFVHSKLLAFLMTLGCGLLGLMSIAVTVGVRMYGGTWPLLARYGGKGVALALSYLLFFLIYRIVPEAVGTRTALKAAVVAGSAWEVVKYVFVARLPGLRLEAFYGPLAFSVSLVIWAYVSSLVLVFGALVVPAGRARRK